MINRVYNFIKENNLLKCRDSVVLGVSGGADSMFMLHALNQLKEKLDINLFVVHVNHNIRTATAIRDAEFVEAYCREIGVDFTLVDVDVKAFAKEKGLTEEEAGRILRYENFERIRQEKNATKIAVAHNLNDNSETILFNLFRGTGIKGLTGIPVSRNYIVRPILCVTRAEIEDYCNNNNIDFCIDETNSSTKYTRNKIRLDLIPDIKSNINEKAEYNIVGAADNLKEISDFIHIEVDKAYNSFVSDNVISCKAFELHDAIFSQLIRRIIEDNSGLLKDITRSHVLSVMDLKNMEVSKKVDLPYNLEAIRVYDGIVVRKKEIKQKNFIEKIIFDQGRIIDNDIIQLSIENKEIIEGKVPDLLCTKWLDCDKISRLSLRNRLPGDYLVISDDGRRKKLKDFLIDEKIPREDRDDLLLVADGSHIVWIIGYRISSYYKVNQNTVNILKLELKNT